MTALSAAARRIVRNKKSLAYDEYVVATAAVIYQGALCVIGVDNRIQPATKIGAHRFVGMAEANATGNTAGTVKCVVSWDYEVKLAAAAGLTADFVTASVVVEDDNTVTADGAVTATLSIQVGEYVATASTGQVWVKLRPGNFLAHEVAV